MVLKYPKGAKPAPSPGKKGTPDSKKNRKKFSPPTQPGTDEEKTEFSSGPSSKQTATRVNSFTTSNLSISTNRSGKKQADNFVESNIVLFMPYLHWETDDRWLRMREAIDTAHTDLADCRSRVPLCHDETLIRAHLESSLHLRRTLDQYYLHGVDTTDRDQDQVVYRYCSNNNRVKKLYMVDQLWMWVLGPELIITAFPQRWQQPKNDPLNVLDGIIEDINAKTGATVQTVYDLALLVTARTSGSFDRHKPGDEDYQFFDMFESSIGDVKNKETTLYRNFYADSREVHSWLESHREPASNADYPKIVDRFLDIGNETHLLEEIKDIRDELNMISMVLNSQKSTLPSLCDAICEDMPGTRNQFRTRDIKRRVEEQKRTLDMHLNELDRMAKLSEGIEASLLSLLDLKQKQSSGFEARFARDQAAGTVRQGQIIMVFTMVTIIFLPMSFLAAFFTIPIEEFPKSSNSQQPLLHISYVSKFIFGIGLGVSVILIALAFSINPLTAITYRIGLPARRGKRYETGSPLHPYLSSSKQAELSGRYSMESARKSLDVQEMETLAGARKRSRSISLIRRQGYGGDVEKG